MHLARAEHVEGAPVGVPMFTWMSWVSHWSATASMPIRGMPISMPRSQIHAFTDSRISGFVGLLGEDELTVVAQPAGQVRPHLSSCSPDPPVERAHPVPPRADVSWQQDAAKSNVGQACGSRRRGVAHFMAA